MKYKFSFLILLFLLIIRVTAQKSIQAIAILDLTERNGELNEARLFSSIHVIDVVGIPQIVTKDLSLASKYSMIFCTSKIDKSTFSTSEEDLIKSFVEAGGTLVAPRLENDRLFELFGVVGYEDSKLRYEINWAATLSSAFQWINEPEEQVISLGKLDNEEIFKTLGYETMGAETLAYFSDSTSAVTLNAFGSGHAITLGVSWKDVILRNQINRDYEAQRSTSNGFEPTTDVFMLFIRGLFLDHNPYSVWKNTSPDNSKSTLMITHDIDSQSGMDSLSIFVDLETEKQIEATYNVTLKYFNDALSSAFYNNHQQELEYVINSGHQIQSHSVGHFFDFADDDIVGKGEAGNTKDSYNPYNDGVETSGATVYGECEVSKNELESDLNILVRTFRAGHLAYPKDLVEVLEALNYEYNSSYSANDVLTNFPYQNVIGRSFNQKLSSIYEIPVTISDIFANDPISKSNYIEKAERWIQTTIKNTDNSAPTVLLLHPNRTYKLEALKYFLNGIDDQNIKIMEIGKYGDFWKNRKVFSYTSEIEDSNLTITIPEGQDLSGGVSLIIKDGQDLSIILVQNVLNESLSFTQENWEDNDLVIWFGNDLTSTSPNKFRTENVQVYPNPTMDIIHIELNQENLKIVKLSIHDISGNTAYTKDSSKMISKNGRFSIDLNSLSLPSGVYFVVLEFEGNESYTQRIVLI